MKVETGHVVTLTYDITDAEGEIIESSDLSGPVSFLVGKGAIIPGLDKRVIGMAKGEEKTFELPPEEAFGRPEDGPTKDLGRKEFPAEAKLEEGMRFEAGMGAGGQKILLEVVSADDEKVISSRVVVGCQPSCSLARVGSPSRVSTSAGR